MLRDYQHDLLVKTVDAFKAGYRRPLIVAPCGAGKSYIFAEMICRTHGEALVLTHRQELKDQHEELFRKLGITNVRVAMILTEANHLGMYPRPALIVADEAHLSKSNSWQMVIEYYNTYTLGFTATPIRLDGKPLGDIYDTLIEGVDVRWLIDHERLAPYEYYAPTLVDVSKVGHRAGDFDIKDLDNLMSSRAIYSDAIQSYCRFARNKPCIVYCVSVQHAKETALHFTEAGFRAAVLYAGSSPVRRREVMNDFRAGKISILCNVGIISEGISIDEVSCCMLLRPTESIALGIQQMMRCMRFMPGKLATIIDCVGNYTRVGVPDEPRVWSLDKPTYRKREFDENGNYTIRCCPRCYMTFSTAPVCPYCGEVYPLHPRELQMHKELQLQRITAEEAARVAAKKAADRMEQGRARTFEELVRLGYQRGYKNPAFWAGQVLRGRKR